jgi:hypothetical protein
VPPKATTLTQASERGTLYSIEEIRALGQSLDDLVVGFIWMARVSPTQLLLSAADPRT